MSMYLNKTFQLLLQAWGTQNFLKIYEAVCKQ